MKTKLIVSLAGSILFVIMTITSNAQWWKDWEKYENNPVIHSSDQTWFLNAGSHDIIHEDGLFKMWFTGWKGGNWTCKVSYAESVNGLDWDIYELPVLEGVTGHWNEDRSVHTVIRSDDTLRMWYDTHHGGIPVVISRIGYAWSLDGLEWNSLPDPVLEPDGGTWESDAVSNPTVYYDGTTYHMYYFSNNSTGYATSLNGVDWNKYGNTPVMEPGLATFYEGEVFPAGLFALNDTVHMWFTGTVGLFTYAIGYAWSTNYVDWTIIDEPALEGTPLSWDEDFISLAKVLLIENTYNMWYTGGLGVIGFAEGYQLSTLCFTDGVTLSSQLQIDNFLSDYPYCEEIGGDVEISGSNITNLNGLSQIEMIDGDVNVYGNESLENFSGLDNLISIKGNFRTYGNNVLVDFSGLENLIEMEGDLTIADNDLLDSLIGLENIASESIEDLRIIDNDNLSYCNIESICFYLLGPNGTLTIENNGPGCEDIATVDSLCVFPSISELQNYYQGDVMNTYPNPFSVSTTIQYQINKSGLTEITIYNHLGKQVELLVHETQKAGEHQVAWNATNLPAGVYFSVLRTESGMKTTKMMKMK